MKTHVGLCLPYLHFFYTLEEAKIGNMLSITQLFSQNSEFNTSASRCCAKAALKIAIVYDDELALTQTDLSEAALDFLR